MKTKCLCLLSLLIFSLAITSSNSSVLKAAATISLVSTSQKSQSDALRTGSLAGGNLLYIKGSGLLPDLSLLSVTIGGLDCPIDLSYTSNTWTACKVPPAASPGKKSVVITVAGIKSTCDDSICSYTYASSETPAYEYIVPNAMVADRGCRVGGFPRVSSSNSLEFKINQYSCTFNSYGDQSLNGNSLSFAKCQIGNIPAGYYTTSLSTNGKGTALKKSGLGSIPGANGTTPYDLVIVPEITSFDTNSAPKTGTLLHIKGSGFSSTPEENIVMFEGKQACVVKNSNYNQVMCSLKDTQETVFPAGTLRPGHGGLTQRIFSNQTLTNLKGNSAFKNSNGGTIIMLPSFEIPYGDRNDYSQSLEGFYKASATGDHVFYLSASGPSELYISRTPLDNSTLEIIASIQSGSEFRNFYDPSESNQVSAPISLIEGQYYYMRALHQAIGTEHLSVAVSIPNSTPNNPLAQPEIVSINLAANVTRLEVVATITNSTSRLQVYLLNGTTFIKSRNFTYASCATDIVNALSDVGIEAQLLTTTYLDSNGNTVSFSQSTKVQFRLKFFTQPTLKNMPGFNSPYLGGFAKAADNTPTPLVSGTYQIAFGTATVTLDFDATASSVEDAFNAAFNTKSAFKVLAYGRPEEGQRYIIFFDRSLGNIPDCTLLNNGLAGGTTGTVDVQLKLIQDYSTNTFVSPISPNFLYTAVTSPQITVTTNGLRALCSTNCGYTAVVVASTATTIIRFNWDGLLLTIDFANADTKSLSNFTNVWFAGNTVSCNSFDKTAQRLTCTLISNSDGTPQVIAGSFIPEVYVSGEGYAVTDAQVTPVSILPVVNSVTTQSIATGFLQFSLTGANFGFKLCEGQSYGTQVTIGGVACDLQTLSNNKLTCNANLVVTSGPLVITVNQVDLSVPFDNQTPEITLETNAEECSLDIKGSFTDSTTVSLVNTDTNVSNTCRSCLRNSTFVRCKTCGLPPGSYNAIATTFIAPTTYKSSTSPFEIKFYIDSISPKVGSQLGGTVITINGWGFSNTLNENQVAIGCKDGCETLRCNVIESNLTQLKCVTEPNTVGLSGPQDLQAFINLEFGSTCSGDCNFEFSDAYTPQIYTASASTIKSGDQLTLEGSLLSSSTVVTIDGLVAPIISTDSNTITVQVPDISAQPQLSFTASDAIYGQYAIDPSIVLSSQVILTNISPKTGSKAGAILTLTGYGFNSNAQVLVGNVACSVLQVTALKITCKAGANSNGTVTIAQDTFTGVTCNGCSYAYDNALTPTASSVIVDNTPGNFQITITGSLLNVASPLDIKLTSSKITQSTTIVSATASQIILSVAKPIPGIYTIDAKIGTNLIQYSSASLATITVNFTQTSDVVPLTTVSQAGGSDLALHFDQITLPQDSSLVQVKIAGFDCAPSSIGTSSLTCTLPPLITPNSRQPSQETELTGSYISSSTQENPSYCFDDNTGTNFVGAVADCFVGLDVGVDLQAELTQIQFFPKTDIDVSKLLGGVFEGSNDGTTYEVFYTLSANIYSGFNTIQLDTKPTYRFFRFRQAAAQSKCELAELSFKGTLLSSFTVTDPDVVSVDNAVVTINGLTLLNSVTVNVQYRKDSTPTVTSITPKIGTSAGGTVVTITGDGFGSTLSDTAVLIDNTVCTINTVTSTQVTCTTGALPNVASRTARLTGQINLKINGKGSAITTAGVSFLYAEKWSDARTWGCGGLPIEGDSVHVPIGMNLFVDVSPPRLVAVVVEGSLIFDDQDLEFQAEYIMIRNGIMRIGTEDEPIQNKIKIILNGLWDDKQLPIFGNKAIALYEGLIDIHGQPRTQTNTTLAATAFAGDQNITVESVGDWAVGEEIAISSTSLVPTENELRTIVDINGNVITLDSPLTFTHLSESEAITTTEGQTQTVQVKALIALLTRNIVIQGNEDDSKESKYGATMLFYDPGTQNTVVRISNTEFTYVGQAAYLERHPINFQNTENQINSYIVGCSIHKSFNKGIQVKGTQYLTVSNNVFFDIANEAFLLPDGSEKNNLIEDNVIIQVTPSQYVFNSYNTPPAISVANPLNFIRRNKIAGVSNNGFTFTYNTVAQGAFFSSNICPQGESLGAFEDNSVLSCGATGLFINTYFPRTLACKSFRSNNDTDPFAYNRPIQAIYKNLTVSRAMTGFQAWNLGAVVLDGFKISDTKSGAIEVRHALNSPMNSTQVTNAFLVGNLQLPTGSVSVSDYWGINVPSDDGFTIDSCSFAHFGSSASAVLGCSNCDDPWENTGSRVTFLKSTKFTDVSKRIGFISPYTHIFRDLDGSLTDTTVEGGATVVYDLPHLRVPECQANSDLFSGLVCNNTLEIRGLNFWSVIPSYVQRKTMNILRLTEGVQNYDASDYTATSYRYPQNGYSAPFATGYPYQLFYSVGLDFDSLNLEISPLYVPEDYPIHLTFNYTEPREEYEVLRNTFMQNITNITNTTTLWSVYSKTGLSNYNFGDFYNDVENKSLYFAVTGNSVGQPTIWDENDASIAKIKAYRCRWNCPAPLQDDGLPTVERKWSDAKGWSNGIVPQDGDSVIIEENEIVTLDIDTASLGTLEIRGTLKFSDQAISLTLTAKIIWVRGQLIAGTDDTPYKNQALIKLTGTIVDEPIVVNFAVDAGTKVLIVTGTLSLVGQTVNPLVRLGASVNPGDQQLQIVGDITSFKKGDQIVLAPSGSNPSEHESLLINEIDLTNNIITVQTSCKYFHYGSSSPFTTLNSQSVDMRTEVVLMTRNVQIQGTQEGGLGGRVLVTSEVDVGIVTGVVTMKYVSLTYCGQAGTDRAGITFEFASAGTGSNITGCTIQNSVGNAVRFQQANLVTFDSNIIYKTQHYGVRFLDNNIDIEITNNVIIAVNPDGRGKIIDLYDYSAGIVIYDSTNSRITISDNLASGCLFSCFFIRAPACDASNFFTNNIGHSAKIGLVAYEDLKTCITISDFTAYRTTYGVQSYYRINQIQASNLLLLDNTMSLNLASSSDGIREITVSNSYFAGTALKDCPECYTVSQCSQQTAIGLGAFNNETRPDKFQFYRSFRDQVLGSYYKFVNNSFENFEDGVFGINSNLPQCNNNTIFLASQYATDFIPYVTIEKSTIKKVDWNALANFKAPYTGDWNCGPEVQCTLGLNSLIKDLDGTLSANSNKPAALLPTHSTILDNFCNSTTSSLVCTQSAYGLLGFKNLDVDKSTLVLDYVTIANSDSTFINKINSHRDNNPREKNDTQKWTSIIKVGQNYDLTFLHDIPVAMDFELQGEPTDSVLVKIPYRDSRVARVINSVTGQIVSPCTAIPPNAPAILASHPCGTYIFDRTANTVQFKLTGEATCKLIIQQTNSLIARIRFDISISEFFQQGGFAPFIDKVAAILNIPTYRIRVVGVTEGSTILDFHIDAEAQGVGSSTTANPELANFAQMLQVSVSSGTLNMYGAPVLNYNQNIVYSNDGSSQKSTTISSGAKIWAIILGVVAAILLVAAGVLFYKRKLRNSVKIHHIRRSIASMEIRKSIAKIVPEIFIPKAEDMHPMQVTKNSSELSERGGLFKQSRLFGNKQSKEENIESIGDLEDLVGSSLPLQMGSPTEERNVSPIGERSTTPIGMRGRVGKQLKTIRENENNLSCDDAIEI